MTVRPLYGEVVAGGEFVTPVYGEVVATDPPWNWDWDIWALGGYPYDPGLVWSWEEAPGVDEAVLDQAMLEVEIVLLDRFAPWLLTQQQDFFVGWSQPPHPIDVIPSFDPHSPFQQQARDVLFDYFHDDDLRNWADDGDVKRCFKVQKKEDYDPTALIAAYENPHAKVWSCHGGQNSWQALDHAVKAAIQKRTKLGPLPKSSYDAGPSNSSPIVIYYYDNDRMKKITYPPFSIPAAMNPSNITWWKWGAGDSSDAGKQKGLDDVHTWETQDSQAIALERKQPGFPGGGHWGNEGFSYDKDVAGNVGPIVSTIMQIVGSVMQVVPGLGTAVGSALITAAPYVQTIVSAVDTAFQGGDNAAALDGIAHMVLKAAQIGLSEGANINIPPAAMTALSTTVDSVAKAVDEGQKQKLDFGTLWANVAAKANTFGKLGDDEAQAIAAVLGENAAGNVFIKGHTAGKLTDPPTIAAIAKIMQSMTAFTDPKIVNIFLLGAGIGYLTRTQEGLNQGIVRKKGGPAHPAIKNVKKTGGHRTGGVVTAGARAAEEDLDHFVGLLANRYNIGRGFVGQDAPPVWEPTAWGCPRGTWWDSLEGRCRLQTPTCPVGFFWDPTIQNCRRMNGA